MAFQPKLVNKQFNSPINLYSQKNVQEVLDRESQILSSGVVGINFYNPTVGKPANLQNSAVLRMLEEEESRQKYGLAGNEYIDQTPKSIRERLRWPPPQYQQGNSPIRPSYKIVPGAKRVEWPPKEDFSEHEAVEAQGGPQYSTPPAQQQPISPTPQHRAPLAPLNIEAASSPIIQSPISPNINKSPVGYNRPETPTKGWAHVYSPKPHVEKEHIIPVQLLGSPQVTSPRNLTSTQQSPLLAQSNLPATQRAPTPFQPNLTSTQHGALFAQPNLTATQRAPTPIPPNLASVQRNAPSLVSSKPLYQPGKEYIIPVQQYQSPQYQPENPFQSAALHVEPVRPVQAPHAQFAEAPQLAQLPTGGVSSQAPNYNQQAPQPQYRASTPVRPVEPPPSTIILRPEAPVSQAPPPVFTSQPATATFKGGKNLRGDLKWPPESVKVQAEEENRLRMELAKGPVCRPRRVNKDYTGFFAQHALNSSYPGYKAPPGTQYSGSDY